MIAHFWNGIKEGYPLCCIEFFTNSWLELGLFGMWDYGHEYIICPECIVKKYENLVKYND